MLNLRQLLITLAMLTMAGVANAALVSSMETDELGLKETQLPAHSSGYVTFRPCPECEPVRRQVSINTTYQLGASGRQLGLREFLAIAGQADNGALYVAYDLETGIVNRIILSVTD